MPAGAGDRATPAVMVPVAITFAGAVWLVVAIETATAAAAAVAVAPTTIVVAVADIPKPCMIDTDGIAAVVAQYETLAAEIFASLPAVATTFAVGVAVLPVVVSAVLFRRGATTAGAITSVVAASAAGIAGVWSAHICDTYMDVADLPMAARYLVDPNCGPTVCPNASVIFGQFVTRLSACDPKLRHAVTPFLKPGAMESEWATAATGVCTDIIAGGWWVFAAAYATTAAAVVAARSAAAAPVATAARRPMQLYTFRLQ